ncbi:MAG: hypothetical protein M3O70_13890 [Actinomycetota bacterium]|nr:hypothetical protein [Actinomycetota bacterium]
MSGSRGLARHLDRFFRTTKYVYPDLPGRPYPRRDGGLLVSWWWSTRDRAAIAVGPGFLVVTRPGQIGKPDLTFADCDQVMVTGASGPYPGAVEAARHVTVTLEYADVRPWRERKAVPAHAEESLVLSRLRGRPVELAAEGEAPFGPRKGVLVEAGLLDEQVVACLDDGTVAIVHRPERIEVTGETVRIRGDFERVVIDGLDGQEPFVTVVRPGELILTPKERP